MDKFEQKIGSAFVSAWSEINADVLRMLRENCEDNEKNDRGDQAAQLTLTPKIMLTFAKPDKYMVKIRIQPKQIRKVTGEYEEEFALSYEQPELPAVPGHNAFYARFETSGGNALDLDRYFVGSDRWGDYDRWIAAGNAAEAVQIMANDEDAKKFVALVTAALN